MTSLAQGWCSMAHSREVEYADINSCFRLSMCSSPMCNRLLCQGPASVMTCSKRVLELICTRVVKMSKLSSGAKEPICYKNLQDIRQHVEKTPKTPVRHALCHPCGVNPVEEGCCICCHQSWLESASCLTQLRPCWTTRSGFALRHTGLQTWHSDMKHAYTGKDNSINISIRQHAQA